MRQLFMVLGVLNIGFLIYLVFFMLENSKKVKNDIIKIKRTFRAEAYNNPFDTVKVFNTVMTRCGLKGAKMHPLPKSKYILFIYDKNNKKKCICKIIEITNQEDISQIAGILRTAQEFSYGSFYTYLREYRTVPSWIDLKYECLRETDPYTPNLSTETLNKIAEESKNNSLYYIHMISSNPGVGPLGEFAINLANEISKPNSIESKTEKKIKDNTDIELPFDIAKMFTIGEINTIIKRAKKQGIEKVDMETAKKLVEGPYTIHEDNCEVKIAKELLDTISLDSPIKTHKLGEVTIKEAILSAAKYFDIAEISRNSLCKLIYGSDRDEIYKVATLLGDMSLLEYVICCYDDNCIRVPLFNSRKVLYRKVMGLKENNVSYKISGVTFDKEAWTMLGDAIKEALALELVKQGKTKATLKDCLDLFDWSYMETESQNLQSAT